jgi:serine/threonine protein kinase
MEIVNDIQNSVHVTQTPSESEVKGKVEKKGGKRIGYNYIIIKSLKESQKNDVVKCLYIKSLTNFGFCVIKEGSYGDSKDKQGRDIKDRLLWQKELHQQLQDKVRLPRYIGSFEENGNYYLVIERIKGKSLYKACRDHSHQLRAALITGNKLGITFINYLIQLVNLLDDLHKQQVVHRDVSSNNFMIMPNKKVAVIDMELSYSLGQQSPNPPFQLGTYGYMSAEQVAMAPPTVQQDIFSVGAIMLQVWTGISPTKLTDAQPEDLCANVRFFIPDKAFADIVLQCLHKDPEQRPTLTAVRQVLTEYRDAFRHKQQRPSNKLIPHTREQVLDLVQEVIGTLSSPLMATEEQGWFSEDKKSDKNKDKNKINKTWYTSFANGTIGTIYMLSKAHKLGLDVQAAMPHIQKGLDLVETKYINRIDSAAPNLHAGASGIAASLAAAMRSGLIPEQSLYIDWIDRLLVRPNDGYGYTHGMAGQGIAHWLCHPFVDEAEVQLRLLSYVTSLLEMQEKDGCWLRSKGDKKKRVTRGFASGMAGIIYFLLEYGHRYHYADALQGAERGLQWLMKKSMKKKDAILWKSASDKDIAPWWSEGSPGIALAFMKAFTVLKDPRYATYATGALRNHPAQVIDTNFGQYNGLSGLGEVYLEAYRTFKDREWLNRAGWIVQVLMHAKKQHPEHGPYWLVEHERQPVADFMTGNSGVLHFLLRYCYPERVGFPLLV